MIETTLSQLRQLKLNGMASALQTQRDQPGTFEGLAFAERLQCLVDHEDQERQHRKQDRLTRAAEFKLKAHVKDIDYQHARGLQQSQMASLLMCDWLKKAQNLLLTGPCGTGKTYVACALGHQACKGVAIFAKDCFGHPSPSNRQKLNATNHCLRRPSRSLRLGSGQALLLSFYTQQGV